MRRIPGSEGGSKRERRELEDDLRRVATEARQRREEVHPPIEALAAYHSGMLPEEERENVQDHLALCSECTRLLLDLENFGGLEPPNPEDVLTDEDVSAQLASLQARIRTEGDGQGRLLPFEPRALPSPPKAPGGPIVYRAATAALAAVVVGLGVWSIVLSRRVTRLSTPRFVARTLTLDPIEAKADRGEAESTSVRPRRGDVIVLALGLVDARHFAAYRVQIRDGGGRSVWSGEVPEVSAYGDVAISVPAAAWRGGRYEIELYGLGSGGEDTRIATYALVLRE